MASREIRDLSPATQVLFNKFYDRCRRDTYLLKYGYTVLLTCTYRSEDEQEMLHLSKKAKICTRGTDGKPASRGFEIIVMQYGLPVTHAMPEIAKHATSVGLHHVSLFYFESP